MTKFVFVTGGVVSSIGKGITAASMGRVLKSRGVSLSIQKLDPYLNVDPGTMSPYQHGEVFVTKDGCETDLDLGHYERFTDLELTRLSNVTAGEIYGSVIARERRGDFLGGTIQVVPHVTNQIKERIYALAREAQADVVIVEVGGTVGDIEGLPFLEAIRQMRNEVGRENALFVHLTLLPYISATGELKTKPTQHSVKELRGIGIQPDIIVLRSDYPVPDEIKAKVALFCDVPQKAVIPLPTVSTIYEVPLILEEEGLGELLVEALGLPASNRDLNDWKSMVERIKTPKSPVSIGIVGKYVQLQDSYLSVREALRHAALQHDRDVEISWIQSEEVELAGGENLLKHVQGIVVPGGFGSRGIEGMIKTARYARENQIPYLGLCLGMQIMVVEFARYALNAPVANSTEFDEETPYPVIDLLPQQKNIRDKGGTMRLGTYPCHLVPGSLAARAYGEKLIYERHRHRYELNNRFRAALAKAGLLFCGLSPDEELAEISEVVGHPFMIGTQFHPEFRSRPDRPHPLFTEFVGVAKDIVLEGRQRPLPLEG